MKIYPIIILVFILCFLFTGCLKETSDPTIAKDIVDMGHSQIQIEYPAIVTLQNQENVGHYNYWVKISLLKGSDVFLSAYWFSVEDNEGNYWTNEWAAYEGNAAYHDLNRYKISPFNYYYLGPTWVGEKSGNLNGGAIHLKFTGSNNEGDTFQKEILIKTISS